MLFNPQPTAINKTVKKAVDKPVDKITKRRKQTTL
jgi:hypothetical protein